MTPEELIERVRNSVNNIDVEASAHDTAMAMFRAGMTVATIGLNRLDDEAERERQLCEMEANTRDCLARLASGGLKSTDESRVTHRHLRAPHVHYEPLATCVRCLARA